MSTAIFMTDAALMQLPKNGHKYEYVNGEVVMSPAKMPHERVSHRLGFLVELYLQKNPIAEVYGSSTGFRMASGNLLSPDLSVVLLSHFPGGEEPEGFGYFAPDIAVEVVSPSERKGKLAKKIEEYFANGSQLVLVINPKSKTVTVYRSPENTAIFSEYQTLELSPILPGFSCQVGEIFKKRTRS